MKIPKSAVLIIAPLIFFILPARVILLGDRWDWIEIISGVIGLVLVYVSAYFLGNPLDR